VIFRILPLLCFIIFFSPPVHALTVGPIKGTKSNITLIAGSYQDDLFFAALTLDLDEDWKVYWKNPGDSGLPISVSTDKGNVEVAWPIPVRSIESYGNFNSESYVYKDKVTLPLIISGLNPDQPQSLIFRIDYGICKDICVPASQSVRLYLDSHYHHDANLDFIQQTLDKTPHINQDNSIITTIQLINNNTIKLILNSTQPPIDLFVDGGNHLAVYKPSFSFNDNTTTITAHASLLSDENELFSQPIDVVLVWPNKAEQLSVTFTANDIVTVAPEPEITVITQEEAPVPLPQYSLFIILAFALLGGLILNIMPCVLPVLSIKLLSVLKQKGKERSAIRKSFLLTSVGIIASFLVLGAITSSLSTAGQQLGWGFHFQQPFFILFIISILTLFAANMWGLFEFHTPQNIPLSSNPLFTGFFATLMATPCSAPFLGTAAGFALTQSMGTTLLIFSVIGTGMALPYLIVAMIPTLVNLLPQPGRWMLVVRHLMGYLLAATIIWLLWVLTHQWGIQSAAIASLIVIGMIIATLLHKTKLALIGGVLLLFAPVYAKTSPALVEETNWELFDQEAITTHVNNGNLVFVDITASWCLTCKFNKFNVLEDATILSAFKNNQVILMRGDWTNHNDTIASFLEKHGRAGIPFNIVYGPSRPTGIILPELLSNKDVLDALNIAK